MSILGSTSAIDRSDLEETVRALAAIDRPSGSPGERQAAEWLAHRFEERGCRARIEEESSHASYWWTVGLLSVVGVVAGKSALRGRRRLGVLGGLLAAAGIADEISNGPRLVRRALLRPSRTWNVLAEAGDDDSDRTLVVLAHHDAPRTGAIFDPRPQQMLGDRFPDFIERTDTAIPLWWPVVAAPLLVALGAAIGRDAPTRLGMGLGLGATAAFADIAHRGSVPGANDNLSGVAVIVALARALQERPVSGLRVLLVSCGSEESLQGGIRPFGARHFPELPVDRTWFLNMESVGSPTLALMEGEGPLVMEDYPLEFRECVASCAAQEGIALRRGLRGRSSTDGVIPMRAGYPTATLISVNRYKAISNYHWPTDTPENVNYRTVESAARVGEAVIRRLAGEIPAGA